MSVCLYCHLSYPEPKSHLFCTILYCHLWPVCLAVPYFPHYLITAWFSEKVTEHNMCVLISSTTLVWKIPILIRIKWDMRTYKFVSPTRLNYGISLYYQSPSYIQTFQKNRLPPFIGISMYCLGTLPNSIPSIWKMQTVGSFESVVHIYKITLPIFIVSIMRTLDLTIVNPTKIMHVSLSTL